MEGVVEANLGDRCARDGRQERSAQGVAERVAEAGLQRADGEPLTVGLFLVDGLHGGALDDEHLMRTSVLSGRVWGGRVRAGGRSRRNDYLE